MTSVEEWLASIGLEKHAAAFRRESVGLDVLAELGDADLIALGIPLGDRKRLLRAIAALRRNDDDAPAEARAEVTAGAERRQLTVMFCDLVGSTDLAARLDPEDVRDGIRRFQHCCDEAVRRFEGHIALYLGDGVLAYFGYPAAHEDDAERAIRAALRIVGQLRGQRVGSEALAVRIGIATGLVVVGDVIGEGAARQEAVTGTTPNLAARLQALAPAGGILVAAQTHRLADGAFFYEDIGRVTLKGLADPEHVWRVAGERPASSRFAAVRTGTLSPFVGRDGEIEQLAAHWQSAKDGHGRAVWISGEPGIGKSRLVMALSERTAADRSVLVQCQCSPFHADSALYPMLAWVEHAAGISPEEDAPRKLEKLALLCAGRCDDPATASELIAAALLLPLGERSPTLRMSAQRQKKETIAVLAALLLPPPHGPPQMLSVEDAHWVDPTTLDVLDLVIELISATPALAIITARAEMALRWQHDREVFHLSLNRLGPRETAAMIEEVAKDDPLPAETVARIVAKTDGIPLFAEELTKTVLESRAPSRAANTPMDSPVEIPATLRDSLMARLDRLGTVKQVAQIGAAIGREFDDALIRRVAGLHDLELDSALAHLTEAGLLFRRGERRIASYTFKHALVQEAAYESLLRSRRLALHLDIAEALESAFPQAREKEPEVIAGHFTLSTSPQRAISYWLRAGQQARERSANAEARRHLNRGLELLRRLPASVELARQEIELLVNLGAVAQAVTGLASDETEAIYTRARDLCERSGDSTHLFATLFNLWLLTAHRGQITASRELADRLRDTAAGRADPGLVMQAHHAAWPTDLFRGRFADVIRAVDAGCALYDAQRHCTHRFVYGGHDPVPCGWIFKALALQLRGDYADAGGACDASTNAARELEHPFTLALCLAYAGIIAYFENDAERVALLASELIDLSTREGFPLWRSFAMIQRGWAIALQGDASGLFLLRQGVDLKQRTGSTLLAPFHLGLLAQAQRRLGQVDNAVSTLSEALALADSHEEHWSAAELLRLKAECLHDMAPGRAGESAALLQRALDVSRSQEAKGLELRAASSLARLPRGDERGDAPRASLARLVAHWAADETSSDLRAARALLHRSLP